MLFVDYSFIMRLTYDKEATGALGEMIAVLSGKGGTGKTSVCAGVATALAFSGKKVLCIDCDIGLRNLDISLALAQTSPPSFMDVCRGHHTLAQALQHPDFPTLFFLTAPINAKVEDIALEEYCAMLRDARAAFDYVLLDAPAGIDQGFRLCAAYADRILLVTNPEPAAVRDAAQAGQLLETMGKAEVRLVVNRISKRLFDLTRITIDDVMDGSGIPLLGIVPEDANVTLSATFEIPLLRYTKRGAAAACKRIAKRITGASVPLSI